MGSVIRVHGSSDAVGAERKSVPPGKRLKGLG
jgi:hypothetical protein